MSQQLAYPASKRSELFDHMHESTNWLTIQYNDWHLPGIDEARDDCGKWLTKGCLNVPAHAATEHKGKVFIKTFQKSCFRASCETCYPKWMGREANKATRRIEKYEQISGRAAKHIIISVPSWEYENEPRDLRKKAYSILKKVNCKGGTLIFHPFRYHKESKQWYYSPHFHCIGFGWIVGTEELYNEAGWIVKNLGLRDSIFGTFYYQLSHAGVKHGYHTLTWFGDLSYSKLKVEQEPNPDVCPLCFAKLRPVYYYGLFGGLSPPETEVEMFLDPEGWQIVEAKPILKPIMTREQRHEFILQRELFYANKGVSY